jgi:hypothetical protein
MLSCTEVQKEQPRQYRPDEQPDHLASHLQTPTPTEVPDVARRGAGELLNDRD